MNQTTTSYITDLLIDTGRFVYDLAVALAQWVLDLVGLGAAVSPEALLGLLLLASVLRRVL